MSIEAYDRMMGKYELYSLLQKDLDDIEAGRTQPIDEAMEDIRRAMEFLSISNLRQS